MVEIVATVMAEGAAEIQRQARLAAMAGATWVELRLDRVRPARTRGGVDPRAMLAQLQLPVLVSCRTPRDGGTFAGSRDERRQLLSAWLAAGARGLDLEEWEEWTPDLAGLDLELYLRSHHNLQGVTENLPAVRDRLLRMGANVAKIAVTAHDLADAAPVLELQSTTDPRAQPTVAFALGTAPWPTRILAVLQGAPLVYGCPAAGLEAAPGQPAVEVLSGLYDVRRLTAATALYGILGNPLAGSLSPQLHNRAFRLLEHDGIFLPFETSRPQAVMAMLPIRRLRGLSVTAPHKAVMAGLCHRLDADAEATGVVNTVTFQAHGQVMGHNSDIAGVQGALARAGFTATGGPGVVLGGGGAARAAAVALARLGLDVTVMPRSLDRMRQFTRRHDFELARLDAGLLTELAPAVVVHATPVGSAATGQEDQRLLPDWQPGPHTFVLDMVYRPRETRLLREVRAAGATPVHGIEMFLTQAARQLSRFTGRQVSEQVLASLVAGVD